MIGLQELNSSMLFKIRDYGLCALLDKGKNKTFYHNEYILSGGIGSISQIESYQDDFKNIYGKRYDIIAIKQYSSCAEVLSLVLNCREPKEWDWVEEVKEEKIKEPTPTVYNMTFNITVDSKTNIDDLVKELSDKMQKTIFYKN
jgi:hypothetical protein